jgi:hypothetical protein
MIMVDMTEVKKGREGGREGGKDGSNVEPCKKRIGSLTSFPPSLPP